MERSKYMYSEMNERVKNAKGIVFSDVDGVWLDENNNFAFPSQASLEALSEAQAQGYTFILNSDTGGDSLLRLSREFGITSDICIAESGSYIQTGNDIIMVQQPDPRSIMREIRNKLASSLTQSGSIWSGDATYAIRRSELTTTSPLFLINAARQCSIGIYARQAGMTVDQQLTEYLNELLRKTCFDIPELEVSQYPAIGSCLIRSKNRSTKAEAVSRFLDITNYSGSCYMIGDTKADDMNILNGRVLTCAVGNADEELKENADFVDNTASREGSAQAIIQFITNS